MRRLIVALAAGTFLVMAVLRSGGAKAATPMLTSSGVTTATTSTCPSSQPGLSGICSSGWFRVEGAAKVSIHVRSTAGSTSSVLIRWRASSSDTAVTLKTITNASATEVPYVTQDGVGEFQIDAATLSAGTVKATLNAISPSGTRLW